MPTIITKTIDAGGGGDYTTFTAAEAAVETIGTSADLVANDEAIVFECVAGTYNESVSLDSALTTDATRNVTYKAAAGSEHGGVGGAGVRIQFGNAAVSDQVVFPKDSFLTLQGLEFHWSSDASAGKIAIKASRGSLGLRVTDCIVLNDDANGVAVQMQANDALDLATYPPTFLNCVVRATKHGFRLWNYGSVDKAYAVTNCTIDCGDRAFDIFSNPSDTTYTITNNLVLAAGSVLVDQGGSGTSTVLGSGNVGGATNPLPVAQQALSQTWTFSTDPLAASTGSQVIYDATTGALLNVPGNDAVGVGTSTGAPATDILGKDRLRGAYADPGAFTTDLVTITKSIDGAGGGDYTTFTAAEAAVTSVATDADLVKRNETLVFEAEAGDYSENFQFFTNNALTCDATRNVEWTHATGAGHGGQFESGANIVGYCQTQEDFSVIDGLSVSPTSGNGASIGGNAEGAVLRNLMVHSVGSSIQLSSGGTATHPCVVENCVAKSDSLRGFDIRAASSGVDAHWRVVNTTVSATGTNQSFAVGLSSSDTIYLELTNNLSTSDRAYFDFGTATLSLTGSNNVGGSSSPFPVAQQASSQTWTFSTDPLAASTGSQVIYDATTGALVNAPGNDAWQLLTDLSVAPATDIEGVTREATGYNPGAFERTAADVGTPIGGTGGIRAACLRGDGIRQPLIRGEALRGPC